MITKLLLPASLNSHRTPSLLWHSCVLVIVIFKTNFAWVHQLVCCNYHEASFVHFSFCFGFLGHCPPFRKVLEAASSLPLLLIPAIRALSTWVLRAQAFIAAQVIKTQGVAVCYMTSSLCHEGSYLITWTPKFWSAGFSMTGSWFPSLNTYLLHTYYMLDTVIGIGAIMVSKYRYNTWRLYLFNKGGNQRITLIEVTLQCVKCWKGEEHGDGRVWPSEEVSEAFLRNQV